MNPAARKVLVVGASIAGYTVARTLTERDFSGVITLLGAENVPPYDRTALSKRLLTTGDVDRIQLGDADELPRWGVVFRPGTVAARVDTGRRVVFDRQGNEYPYDDLVIATGSQPRKLPLAEPAGVHYLRGLGDALALRESLRSATRVVVIGGGFVGAEVASSARALGLEVTVVEAGARLFPRVADPEIAAWTERLHRRNGVAIRTGARVTAVHGRDRVETVELGDGERLPCDVCVIGIGIRPATDWLAGSGIAVRDGVLCGRDGRTAVAGVWAAGDVARTTSGTHTEHWTAARTHGQVIAHNILNPAQPRTLATVPYVWSDQHGVKIQLLGVTDSARPKSREDFGRAAGRFVTTYFDGSRLVGAVGFGAPAQIARLRKELEATVTASTSGTVNTSVAEVSG